MNIYHLCKYNYGNIKNNNKNQNIYNIQNNFIKDIDIYNKQYKKLKINDIDNFLYSLFFIYYYIDRLFLR